MHFRDRFEAGGLLAEQLAPFAHRPDVRVLALPRGGVPVAFAVARRLHAPLDVWVVRKLGAPGIPELAIGAIASGGIETIMADAPCKFNVTAEQFEAIAARERKELERREAAYRGNRAPIDVRGQTVILVDDGIATGASMRAAIAALRRLEPARIVVAVPVAGRSACALLAGEADRVVCLWTPHNFNSVGQWYQDFSQTSDDDVCMLLKYAEEFVPKTMGIEPRS